MTEQLQLRRGTAIQVAAFTGAQGEVVVDTTNNRAVVNDGATAGGWPAAKLAEVVTNTRVVVSDAAYAAQTTDRLIAFTALTAARVVSLPAAAAYPTGVRLMIVDESGACSAAKTITVAANGSDLIDSAVSYVVGAAYGGVEIESNGANAWTILAPKPNLQASLVGIGTAPDPNNVLSAYGASALFNGAANFNVTVNKAAVGDTASFIFEDGFSGRAQIGLCGDDNFHFKVSPNGSTWLDALDVNASTGQVSFNFGIAAGAAPGFRNRIVNGAMAIDQRNAGAAQTFTAGAALAYAIDRFYGYCAGANVTGQRVGGSAPDQYRYQFTGAAGVTAIGFAQRVETANSFDLAGQTATLSVELANSLLTTINWTAYYANSADSFGTLASPAKTQIATGSFTVTSALTKYSAQIAIPSAATTGLEIVLSVGAQTSGTWTIGEAQLEAGQVATSFERRPIGLELALSQRYFQNVLVGGLTGVAISGAGALFGAVFPVVMRSSPTIVLVTMSFSAASYAMYFGGAPITASGLSISSSGVYPSGAVLYILGFSGLTAGQLALGNEANIFFTAAAEL
jgi:hypothetical protein